MEIALVLLFAILACALTVQPSNPPATLLAFVAAILLALWLPTRPRVRRAWRWLREQYHAGGKLRQ